MVHASQIRVKKEKEKKVTVHLKKPGGWTNHTAACGLPCKRMVQLFISRPTFFYSPSPVKSPGPAIVVDFHRNGRIIQINKKLKKDITYTVNRFGTNILTD